MGEVVLLVGYQNIPAAPVAARLLQQAQRLKRVQRGLLRGKKWPQAFVFGDQIGRERVVGFHGLLAGLHLRQQRLFPVD